MVNGAFREPGQHERFGITIDKDDSHVAVDLCGNLDEDSAGLIALWLTPLVLIERLRTVVIHIGLITSMTVEGLDTFVELIELAQHRGCDLRVIAGSEGRAQPLRLDGPASSIVGELLCALAEQNSPSP